MKVRQGVNDVLGIDGTAGGSGRVLLGASDFTGPVGRGVHPGTSVPGWSGEKPQLLAALVAISTGMSVGVPANTPVGLADGPGTAAAQPVRHRIDG